MSGGRLVVLDRLGRSVKQYPLASGIVTLGSAPACNIRVMLTSVRPHHATIAVRANQTIIRNVSDGDTIVNGQSVSVAALRHNDIITLGDRSLRWEYFSPSRRQQMSAGIPPLPERVTSWSAGGGGGRVTRGGAGRRAGSGGGGALRDRALQLAIEMNHRASMPASSGGKQVAIVQPQRRDTNEQPEKPTSPAREAGAGAGTRPRRPASAHSEADTGSRKSGSRPTPEPVPSNTTKATLWIESRKTGPRRKAERRVARGGGRAVRVGKISAPLHLDPTKQAAIMLMAGHTPKSRISLDRSQKSPSFVVKKPGPTPRRKFRKSGNSSRGSREGITPKRASTFSSDRNTRNSENQAVSILETSKAKSRGSTGAARRSRSPHKSPSLLSPKKSALKDLSKKSTRKAESIKFDLSNLENNQDDITFVESEESMSEDDITLHYSESSGRSPTPRKSINSRSSRMLEKVGMTLTMTPSRTTPSASPVSRKSSRGSLILHKALSVSDYTKTEQSTNTSRASTLQSKTLSPRRNMKSYSIVDLVSLDSTELSKSVYDSADSADTTEYGTPPNGTSRRTRSTINISLLGSSTSTSYVAHARATRSRSNPSLSKRSTRSSAGTRRSKSLSTPENKHISVSSARVPRASRSRSRINDSDLFLLDVTELEDSSPKTSRRPRTKSDGVNDSKTNATSSPPSPQKEGISTPENRRSPVEEGTPVLSIQSLLDSSQNSAVPSSAGKGRKVSYKRKTIGDLAEPKNRSQVKSSGTSARQTILRLSKDSSEASDKAEEGAPRRRPAHTATPKSAVKLLQEAVKNKHSTAKKPQSKRSIIDDLDNSDIVKQLFNSPVKRKLSQSMTEFSRKHLEDDDETGTAKRLRSAKIQEDSVSNRSVAFTPVRFVSPLTSPPGSPNLSGIRKLFRKNTPQNDLRNVRGVRSLLRTHRTRRSAKNDLTDVTGVKLVFAKSPRNRLSDVRVKQVFKLSPKNDLRQVSGVKKLFQQETAPKNDLSDVRGVKELFNKSPTSYSDLSNVSSFKRTLRKSPRNDLTNVREIFGHGSERNDLRDVSGVEALSDTSDRSGHSVLSVRSGRDSETLFDQLLGKPPIKAVYSKTFSTKLTQKRKSKKRKAKSLHISPDVATGNVEEWLEKELQKRFHRDEPSASVQTKSVDVSRNTSRNATKALQNLLTSTVEGGNPILASRTRNSSMAKRSASEIYSSHTLPIKKRSLADGSVSGAARPRLPIKKRAVAVLHSTPVKGAAPRVTMNASELGRVSPIPPAPAASAAQRQIDRDASFARTTRLQKSSVEEKPPTPDAKRRQTTKDISEASPANSPPKARPRRVTRIGKNITSSTNTKKRRNSLVVTKKAPVMSPKAEPEESCRVGPQPTPGHGDNKHEIATKRARVHTLQSTFPTQSTVVLHRLCPKMKPQPQTEAESAQQVTREYPRRTRKPPPSHESPKESQPRRARVRQTELKGKENKTDNVQVEKPQVKRRGRNVEVEQHLQKRARENVQTVKGKTRGQSVTVADTKQENQLKIRSKKVVTPESAQSEPTIRRGRRNPGNVDLPSVPKTRGKKTVTQDSLQSEPTTRRGRKNTEKVGLPSVPKTRGKKIVTQESTQSEPISRRGRKETEIVGLPSVPKTRGKKIVTQESTQSEPISRRGRKKTEKVGLSSMPKTRGKKIVIQESTQSEPITRRGRKKTEKVGLPSVSKTRGKKTEVIIPIGSPIRQKGVEEKLIETQPKIRGKEVEEKPIEIKPKTRGQKVEQPIQIQPKTLGTKVKTQTSVRPEPVTRSRRTRINIENTAIPETTRKRKPGAVEEVPPKVAKIETNRGRTAGPDPQVTLRDPDTTHVKTRRRAAKAELTPPPVTPKARRGKKVVVEPGESPARVEGRNRTTTLQVEASPLKVKRMPVARTTRAKTAAESKIHK